MNRRKALPGAALAVALAVSGPSWAAPAPTPVNRTTLYVLVSITPHPQGTLAGAAAYETHAECTATALQVQRDLAAEGIPSMQQCVRVVFEASK